MLALLPYIEKAMLVANLASSGHGARNSAQEQIFFWAVSGLSIISYLLIVAGLGLYLADRYEPPITFIVIGLIILFTVLFALAVTRICKRMRARKIEKTMNSVTGEVTKIMSALGEDVNDVFRSNAGLAAITAAGLGFMVARKIL